MLYRVQASSPNGPRSRLTGWCSRESSRRGPCGSCRSGLRCAATNFKRTGNARATAWLLFLPFGSGAETLAVLAFWGQELPGSTPERLVAILEYWNRLYAAELVANWGTMLQFVVSRPPHTLKDSWTLAVEQELIAPATLVLPGVSLRNHARVLIDRDRWFLHERP